eukprot:4705161-Amphidinium_carterae.1
MQQPCQYPNAESYFVDPATGMVTPVVTPQGQVPLPIHQQGTHYASATPAVGSVLGSAPWRPLGQVLPGCNPLTGLYGTDPPTPGMHPS